MFPVVIPSVPDRTHVLEWSQHNSHLGLMVTGVKDITVRKAK